MTRTLRAAAVAAVAVATLLVGGCASGTAPVTPVTPTPTTGVAPGGTLQRPLYSVVVPQGWTDLGSSDTSGQIDAYLAKDGLSSGISFSVFVDTSGRSRDTLVQQAKAAMPGATDAPAVTAGGRRLTGLQAEAEGLVLHQYYLETGGKLVALNWSWPKDKDASADIKQILDSLTWK
ncbi:hypothetical protein [Raineyella fluvialis]|uniref:Uncharacterized protein n=1 Tax=Raineyella fluvialis TaxID=2662261 RepID=A0A5Q2F8E1_9ACTN|nr:hypothetical protein [Raineyella fluvialis]QGF22928.1 hypothetical protein Rai3103_03770 [Raineyella fluvialis]